VKPVTLRALLRGDLRDAVGESDARAWRFCATADCPLVYFEPGGTTFTKDQLTVRVGIKESTAPRPVCYCFQHTVEEIENDIARTGETGVLDDIRTRMKEACWCETTNPMGSCCLATVTGFVKAAKARRGQAGAMVAAADEAAEDCCAAHSCSGQETSSAASVTPRGRLGLLATGGAVLSAALSSACCWLPLLLLAFGASAAGVAGFFEAWRPWFLGGAALLLGAGFYFAYFRNEACGPGSACAVPNPKLRRFNRVMLWVAMVVVAAFALFPNYLGALLGTGRTSDSVALRTPALPANALVLSIEGMTCASCAVSLEKELAALPGVASARVDYQARRAVVVPAIEAPVSRAALEEAVRAGGYRVGD
jgi:copper chaperone CopZ